ncbi:hypothetical protein [Streptomyces sp. NPDC001889]
MLDHAHPLHALVHEYRAMSDRHKAALDRYLDADGDVEPDQDDAFSQREADLAREVRDWLETAMSTLTGCLELPDGQNVSVTGRDGDTFTVTTGRIDESARDAFLHGQCHALARALADRTGWPMALLISDDCNPEADMCSTSEVADGVCGCQMEHVVAVRPDGAHVDITGAHAPGTLPGYEGQQAIPVDADLWTFITRSPFWRRPALDVARTFVTPLLGSLPAPLSPDGEGA